MGEKEPLSDHQVTHSICPACKATLRLEAQQIKSPGYAFQEKGEKQ
jgi:competence CoiA-like predicted nuclease